MSSITSVFWIIFLSLSASFVYAAPIGSSHFPSDLIYLDKPINPLCLYNPEAHSDTINLKTCSITNKKYYSSDENEFLTKKGFYGFELKNGFHGYSYYKVWQAADHQYWVYTVNSGGGSGEFTSINLLSRANSENITFKPITSGDRCNGGINTVHEEGSNIQYSVNITAADFLTLAQDNPHHLQAYKDLAACAACCTATAHYEADRKATSKLLYVELTPLKLNELSTQGKYQDCFNKLFSSYVSKNERILKTKNFKYFVNEFNKACVKNAN